MSDPSGNEPIDQWRHLFEESLAEIERAVSWAARRLCLRPDDAEDFRSWVHEKLIEDDYRILREFSGRSELATFLVAVIMNLGRDYRMKTWKRWRPSAQAERLGLVAIQLETLVERDGFSMDEAMESVRSNHGVKASSKELIALAAKLPPRAPVSFEGDASLASAAADSRADQGLRESERTAILAQAREALADSMRALDVEDRLVLKMHYQSGLTIATISTALDLDQRSLYTRRDRCLRQLKKSLEAKRLQPTEIFEALGWAEADFKVDYAVDSREFGSTVPSNQPRAEVEDSP